MAKNRTYLLLAAAVAAGLALSGVSASACACPAVAVCCGPSCQDAAHGRKAAKEEPCCCGEENACAVPGAPGGVSEDRDAPHENPCSCRMARREPVLRNTGPSPDSDGLSAPLFRTDSRLPALFAAASRACARGGAVQRGLHARLCVWTC